jgi:hypothetical protein
MTTIHNEDFSPALRRLMEGKGQSSPTTVLCVQPINRGAALCYEELSEKGVCPVHGRQWKYVGAVRRRKLRGLTHG